MICPSQCSVVWNTMFYWILLYLKLTVYVSQLSKTGIIHYDDIIMSTMASQITSLTSVYWIVYSGTDQRRHQSSASLAFVRGIHRSPVNSPQKVPVTWKMSPFDDVIMILPVMRDHLSWQTTGFNGHFIKVSVYVCIFSQLLSLRWHIQYQHQMG